MLQAMFGQNQPINGHLFGKNRTNMVKRRRSLLENGDAAGKRTAAKRIAGIYIFRDLQLMKNLVQ